MSFKTLTISLYLTTNILIKFLPLFFKHSHLLTKFLWLLWFIFISIVLGNFCNHVFTISVTMEIRHRNEYVTLVYCCICFPVLISEIRYGNALQNSYASTMALFLVRISLSYNYAAGKFFKALHQAQKGSLHDKISYSDFQFLFINDRRRVSTNIIASGKMHTLSNYPTCPIFILMGKIRFQ